MLSCLFRIVFFGVFLCVFLHMLASTCIIELCAGVWVIASMRLRLVFSFSFGDLFLLGCFPVCVAFRIGFLQ